MDRLISDLIVEPPKSPIAVINPLYRQLRSTRSTGSVKEGLALSWRGNGFFSPCAKNLVSTYVLVTADVLTIV